MVLSAVQKLYRVLFARPRFEKWNRFVFNLGLRGLGVLNFENSAVSGERHLIDDLLPQWLGPEPVIFDVGAHTGTYSRHLVERFPDAQVHAFEPNPKSRAMFDNERGLVNLHPIGLGSKPGTLTLFDRIDDSGSAHASLYPSVMSEIHHVGQVETDVTISTLDLVCGELGVERIDFLKIDVEGHELAVLTGSERMLAGGAIGLIQFEFNEMNVFSRTYLRDFRALLPDHTFYRLLPNGLLPLRDTVIDTEQFAFQNILAVPRDRYTT